MRKGKRVMKRAVNDPSSSYHTLRHFLKYNIKKRKELSSVFVVSQEFEEGISDILRNFIEKASHT